jgi:D-hexose-6-phosphate mutarotase
MATSKTGKQSKKPQTVQPGRVSFLDGQGELPMVEVTTAWSRAEIYIHGAHVTQFKKNDEPPLLFMSQVSRFAEGQPIRGGIPVIFPWFGMREAMGQHGFARIKAWDLKEFAAAQDGSVSVRFKLPDYPEASSFPPFTAEYVVTVNEKLKLELLVTNMSGEEPLVFENCLHTYFEVGDINTVSIRGLKGASYLDKVANFAKKTEKNDAIQINSEVDRIYLNTTGPVEVLDPKLKRKIRVEKNGSTSTVVWNPWIARAQQMPDFGNDEYLRMVCVESGNVSSNQISLRPRETCSLTVTISSAPLKGR